MDYIRKNSWLSVAEMCGVLLGAKCALRKTAALTWQVAIPEKRKNLIKNKNDQSKAVNLVQITDVHLDLHYHVESSPVCGEPLCCRSDSPQEGSPDFVAGNWGSFGTCDSPLNTVTSAFQHIAEKHPNVDYWMWTGDAVPHDFWKISKQSNLEYTNLMTQFLRDYSTAPVLPVIGNHEAFPVNR